MQAIENFEDMRKRSRNGKRPAIVRIGDATARVGVRRYRRDAWIDFDLFVGSMQVRQEKLVELRSEYQDYLAEAAPRARRIDGVHSHFNRRTIWFAVRQEDAGDWFRKILAVLNDPDCLEPDPELVEPLRWLEMMERDPSSE